MGEGFEFDSKGKGGVEASLDDFFQPSDQESSKKSPKAGKPEKAAKKAENVLPIEKSRVGELKDEPEETAPAEAPEEQPKKGKEKKGKEKKAKKEKAAGSSTSKTMIIVLGVVAAFLVVGAGAGYYVYTKFFAKTEEIAITKPEKKPSPAVAKPATPAPQPGPTAAKPAPAKPGTAATAPAQPLKPVAPAKPAAAPAPKPGTPAAAPAIPVKPAKPAPAPAKPAPVPSTAKPAAAPAKPAPAARTAQAPARPAASATPAAIPLPSYAPGKGWSCQVGAYMLRESLNDPLATARSLGYTNLYYIDVSRTLKIYHLYLKGEFDPAQAASKMTALQGIGFKPRLENSGAKQRVIAYSYGKNSIAISSKSKIEQAALGPAEIVARTENVTLHQLRIGPYATRAEAARVVQSLRQKGLAPALVEEK